MCTILTVCALLDCLLVLHRVGMAWTGYSLFAILSWVVISACKHIVQAVTACGCDITQFVYYYDAETWCLNGGIRTYQIRTAIIMLDMPMILTSMWGEESKSTRSFASGHSLLSSSQSNVIMFAKARAFWLIILGRSTVALLTSLCSYVWNDKKAWRDYNCLKSQVGVQL